MKIWDVAGMPIVDFPTHSMVTELSVHAGQPRYRSIWERYCHGVDAVVYVEINSDPLGVLLTLQ